MGRVAFRLCLLLLAATTAADELRLKNGSSFEGKIVAEDDASVIIDVGVGKLTFPKADVASVRRDDTIGAETPPKQEAPSPAPPTDGLFLRDGRCIPGTREPAPEGSVVVRTPRGLATYAEWLVDASGTVREAWQRRRTFSGIDDPALLEELTRRREAWDRGERGDPPLAETVKPLATEIDGIEHGSDSAALVDLAKRIEAEVPSLRGGQLLAARKLAARAWDAAARLTKGPDAAEMFARAYVHMYDAGDFHHLAAAAEILQTLFADDPCAWGPHVERFLALEDFAIACSPGEWDSDARWCRKDVDWGSGGVPPDKLRIVTSTGDVIHTEGPDVDRPYPLRLKRRAPRNAVVPEGGDAPAGIASVWVPEVRDLGTAGMAIGGGAVSVREPGWSRIFWCPVERQWKEDTDPEVLMKRALSPVLEELQAYGSDEVNLDLLPSMRALRDWEGKIDSLAIHEFDPAAKGFPAHTVRRAEEAIAKANALLAEVREAHDRSLRRRVRMQRGISRARQVLSMLEKANRGEKVDVASVSDPSAVWRTAAAGEKEAVLAALGAFATLTRLDTMRESGIDRFAQDREVVAKLLEVAKDDLRHSDAEEATRVLQRWKNPEIAAWLEGRIEGGDNGSADRYEGSVAWWEKAASDGGDSILQGKALDKLGIVEEADRDAAAAALARLAPTFATPTLQGRAIEALVRLHRPDVLRDVVLLLRYPSAREKAARGLSTDAASPALQVLLKAQDEAWRFKRRKRHGEETEEDPEAFRATWKGKLEEKGAGEKLRAAGLDGFESRLVELLDPRRLMEDKWLEEALGGGGTSAPETLATLAQPTELTRDWVRKAAQGSDEDRLRPLLVAYGDEATLARVRAVVDGGEAEGLSMGEAIRALGYSRDVADAKRLLRHLEARKTQYEAVDALRRITGRDELKKPEDWQAWDGRSAPE